jgi:CHAD domain-containing protein
MKDITRRIRKTREKLKDESKADLAGPILRSVDDEFLNMRQRYEHIDPLQPATIQRVRIAFKKIRYIVEVIQPLLPVLPEENLKLMNDHQSMMGEIQDMELMKQTLLDFSQRNSSIDLEPIHRHYDIRFSEAISAYLKDKDIINNFWRRSPE